MKSNIISKKIKYFIHPLSHNPCSKWDYKYAYIQASSPIDAIIKYSKQFYKKVKIYYYKPRGEYRIMVERVNNPELHEGRVRCYLTM